MKINKRMAVRGGAALVSLLGLTTAVSFVVTEANKTGTIATEEGYRISFTGGTQTNSLAVTGLSESTPAYKTISIDWLFSKNVGDGTVKATLALTNTVSTHAITISVAETEWGVEDPATIATINTENSSRAIDLGSVTDENKSGSKSLFLKFTLASTGSEASETTTSASLGSLDVTLSYVASGSAA